jgi:ribonuclease D
MNANAVCIAAGQEGGSGGRTHRLGGVEAGELRALFRQTVKIWRPVALGAETGDVRVGKVVTEDQDDVGRGGPEPRGEGEAKADQEQAAGDATEHAGKLAPDAQAKANASRGADGEFVRLALGGFLPMLSAVIQTAEELNGLAERIQAAPWVGVDTEADSLHAYPEKLCLVQISIPGEEVLVDPLADLHLEPLWESFDRHELIFHAADYDLHLLFTGHHFKPAAIFDTMWAARLLGEPKFGLNDVLQKLVGVTLEKGAQKADWGKRPLTPRMVAYALNDVKYLRPLQETLVERLKAAGRLEWHRQICARLISDAAQPSKPDPESVWRIKGHDVLDDTGLAVLRELWHWREKDALRTGRPPFFILKHETLSEIAAQASAAGVRAVRLPPYLTSKRRAGVLDAVKAGLAVPEESRPKQLRVRMRRMTRSELDYAEQLRERRDARAKELELDPTIVAARATLFALARKDADELARLLPWQREILKLDGDAAALPKTEEV